MYRSIIESFLFAEKVTDKSSRSHLNSTGPILVNAPAGKSHAKPIPEPLNIGGTLLGFTTLV